MEPVVYLLIGVIVSFLLSQPGLEVVQRLRRRITWRAFGKATRHALGELERGRWRPDVIIGLNSGVVPASILALNLRVPDLLFYDGLPEYEDGRRQAVEFVDKQVDLSGKNVLIVDDQAYTGRSLERLVEHLVAHAQAETGRIKRHALFAYEAGPGPVELEIPPFGRVTGGVKEMPWVMSASIKHFWRDRA